MKTILFLDVDGVFSIPTREKADQFEKFGYGLPAWPIPIAFHLIRAIAQHRLLHPVWLSAWDIDSNIWCDKARTKHFPVAYHLSSRQASYALRLLPHLANKRIDNKLIAAQYYLRRFPSHNAVWLEDGFASETIQWAHQEGHVLIDTTQEAVLAILVKEYDDYDKAAREFVESVALASRALSI